MYLISTVLTAVMWAPAPTIGSAGGTRQSETSWRQPSEEVMKVLHAPQLPSVWTAPTGAHLLLVHDFGRDGVRSQKCGHEIDGVRCVELQDCVQSLDLGRGEIVLLGWHRSSLCQSPVRALAYSDSPDSSSSGRRAKNCCTYGWSDCSSSSSVPTPISRP